MMRPDETFSFIVEREKLSNNLASLHAMAEKMSALRAELAEIQKEIEYTRGSVHTLKVQINQAAHRLNLQSALIGKRE